MKNTVKKIVITGILILFSFLLQTSVFSFFSLFGVVPNIILLFVISVALINGSMSAMIVGFLCGLLMDIMYGTTLGVYAFFYMCLGYVNGYFHILFFAEASFMPFILVFVNDCIYHILTYLVFFFPQGKWNFSFYLWKNIIPELIYTTILTLVVYQVFFRIYHWIIRKKKKRRSTNGFKIKKTHKQSIGK